MKRILLSQGQFAIVDDEDFERLNQYKWCVQQRKYTYYAMRTDRNKKTILMHRFIMNPPGEKEIDHKNHDGLDNRKKNLRICSTSQNAQNKIAHLEDLSSKHKGVSWSEDRKKWLVQITMNNKRFHLGRFVLEIDAALAYDKAAMGLFGDFAQTNFRQGC